jgi:hypothetical protein
MIRSIAVVPHASVKARPRAAAIALITVATPGCTIAGRPDLHALHLSFDTLAGELEGASLRVPQATAAVPFGIEHAHAIAAFMSGLQRERESLDLLVCESEGYVRSATVARWAARRLGCPLHEPEQAAAIASCALMDSVLKQLPHPAHDAVRRAPQAADWAVQP